MPGCPSCCCARVNPPAAGRLGVLLLPGQPTATSSFCLILVMSSCKLRCPFPARLSLSWSVRGLVLRASPSGTLRGLRAGQE